MLSRKPKMICLCVLVGLALITNAGCSTTDLVKSVISPDKPSLSVDAQLGDRENSLGNNIEVDSENVGEVTGRDKIRNEAQVINQTNIPTSWFIILMLSNILGWMMPTPGNIWKGICNAVRKDK